MTQRRRGVGAGGVGAAFALLACLGGGPEASAAPPASPPQAPTPAQVAALGELTREADAYESAARDYRGAITRIVQHHYEDRRRRVLAGLDAELAVEKKGLRDAREEAIRRLEAFVAAHSGAAAHPESTPDAMFRLAALYEERARSDTDSSEDLAQGLRPAIALYKRILREFPAYRERAGVHYYLGHAYNDAGRGPEAQQVWRALVCQNHFAYPTAPAPGDPERDTVRPLPQDHDREHWLGWRQQRPAPGGKDLTFENPYPEDCQPVPQLTRATAAGAEPRYLAEAWWLLGDHHFNEVESAAMGGGPFALNRAEAAYRRALRFEKTPVHAVAMYKLAWTYFKQQRYEAAVRQFVELLRAADEQEKRTGDPGADFRREAFTYIAGSLTFVDFAGPDADAPFSPRSDVLDTETDPRAAERKMHVAVDRVQDGRLIPQNAPWTVDVYRALAHELGELGQLHSMIEVDELVLARSGRSTATRPWSSQDEIAPAYDPLAAPSREGTAAGAESGGAGARGPDPALRTTWGRSPGCRRTSPTARPSSPPTAWRTAGCAAPRRITPTPGARSSSRPRASPKGRRATRCWSAPSRSTGSRRRPGAAPPATTARRTRREPRTRRATGWPTPTTASWP